MAFLTDAHCHLTDPQYGEISTQLGAFIQANQILIVCVSMDIQTSIATLSQARQMKDKVIPFVGIHPWTASTLSAAQSLQHLERLAPDSGGLGETGLDRKYAQTNDQYEAQRLVFASTLKLAEKLEKPISVHSRGSQDDVISALSSYRLKAVNLHWFSGTVEQLRKAVQIGCFFSFGPTVVYSKKSQELLRNTPKDLLLTETDGPVSYGACFRNRMALPSFLPSVLFSLSSQLKMTFYDVITLVEENFRRYLSLKAIY